jgi:Ion transport protein
MYNYLHKVFNYLVSSIIFGNLVLLLMSSPLNDPESTRTYLVKRLDVMCTIIFAFEVVVKILSIGFVNCSIEG